jgi:hypothetical protein
MSSHSRQPPAAVWHTYAMVVRRVERPCGLIIRIGQNCPKTPRNALINGRIRARTRNGGVMKRMEIPCSLTAIGGAS